ncbi:hypothetical protein Q7P37_007769 [Cladosporium fusiforme]
MTSPSAVTEPFIAPVSSLQVARDVAEHSGAALPRSQTSTFPGSVSSPVELSSVENLVAEVRLPTKRNLDLIIDTYLRSVHWFMMLFHERSFRSRYEEFLATGIRSKADASFYQFLLVVCVLGCQYMEKSAVLDQDLSLADFQKKALKYLELNIMSICEDSELTSIQICVLLGSFYLYTGRPNLGFVVLGSGIRCAHALGLHKESSWPRLTEEHAEERRRVWWALFIFDRFASIVYGHPCGIQEGEYAVGIPRNLDDTPRTHGHPGILRTPDGGSEAVTLFTYISFKIELYKLSSPILTSLYFRPSADRASVMRTIRDLDRRLCHWRDRLPPELRLDKVRSQTPTEGSEEHTFLLQALTLQVAYDNILILLHRPLLNNQNTPLDVARNRHPAPSRFEDKDTSARRRDQDAHASSIYGYSRDRCLQSASRSAGLCELKDCLNVARNTHAVAYLGINLFTAGTVLCTVALSSPLSSTAQQAKSHIHKILVICEMLKQHTPVATQTKQVLSHLVKVVLDKELTALTSTEPVNAAASQLPTSSDRHVADLLEAQQPANSLAPTQAPIYMNSPSAGQGIPVHTVAPWPSASGEVAASFTEGTSIDSNFDLDLLTGINSLQTTLFPSEQAPIAQNGVYNTTKPNDFATSSELPAATRPANCSIGQTWLWEPGLWNLDAFDDTQLGAP